MTATIRPNVTLRWTDPHIASVETHMCWTCNKCATECPTNIATGKLSPVKLVRMATYGMLDEMVQLPEIWYCLLCRRCAEVCPMSVRPFMLIRYLQNRAMHSGIVAGNMHFVHQQLVKRLQRARWFLANAYTAQANPPADSADLWRRSSRQPVMERGEPIRLKRPKPPPWTRQGKPNISLCLTCGECCSVCPVFFEGDVFSPLKLLRMVVFGLTDRLLASPSIWLCLGCRQCEEVCSQRLSIYQVIRHLQQAAVSSGAVPPYFSALFQDHCKDLFHHFTQAIDDALKINRPCINEILAKLHEHKVDMQDQEIHDCVPQSIE